MDIPDVFISYNSNDRSIVHSICAFLEEHGIVCWIAPRDIPIGSNYAAEIPPAIEKSRSFFLALSSNSQNSYWVDKELSIACSAQKTIFPVALGYYKLSNSFKLYLTNAQVRFNPYGQFSDTLCEVIQEIKKMRAEELTDYGHSFISSPAVNWISSHSVAARNKLFAQILAALRKKYRENPNASIIKSWFYTIKIDDILIHTILESFFDCGLFSYNACEIYIQLATIYIHAGEMTYTHQARTYLEKSLAAFISYKSYDANTFQRVVYVKWLLSITYKQDRNYGFASNQCEELLQFVNEENKIFDLPYTKSLLLPHRELVVLNHEKKMSDYLASKLPDMRTDPLEFFYTQRRLFQLHTQNNELSKAREMIPSLLQSFSVCKDALDSIYKTNLFENLLEYYIHTGNRQLVQKYYLMAYNEATQNFWVRTQNKLETLKQIYSLDLGG